MYEWMCIQNTRLGKIILHLYLYLDGEQDIYVMWLFFVATKIPNLYFQLNMLN